MWWDVKGKRKRKKRGRRKERAGREEGKRNIPSGLRRGGGRKEME